MSGRDKGQHVKGLDKGQHMKGRDKGQHIEGLVQQPLAGAEDSAGTSFNIKDSAGTSSFNDLLIACGGFGTHQKVRWPITQAQVFEQPLFNILILSKPNIVISNKYQARI